MAGPARDGAGRAGLRWRPSPADSRIPTTQGPGRGPPRVAGSKPRCPRVPGTSRVPGVPGVPRVPRVPGPACCYGRGGMGDAMQRPGEDAVGAPWNTLEGGGPAVAVAVHAGHDVRPELEPWLEADMHVRLREEDPMTDHLLTAADTCVRANRSRFEVDLNRPRARCISENPEDTWGLRIWKDGLPEEAKEASRTLHDAFYAEVEALIGRGGGAARPRPGPGPAQLQPPPRRARGAPRRHRGQPGHRPGRHRAGLGPLRRAGRPLRGDAALGPGERPGPGRALQPALPRRRRVSRVGLPDLRRPGLHDHARVQKILHGRVGPGGGHPPPAGPPPRLFCAPWSERPADLQRVGG